MDIGNSFWRSLEKLSPVIIAESKTILFKILQTLDVQQALRSVLKISFYK